MRAMYMPQNLDEPMFVMKWSADELLPGMAVFIFGVLVEQKLLALVIALLAIRIYRKTKEGRPDGFLLHWFYWIGLFTGKGHSMPNAHIKEYLP